MVIRNTDFAARVVLLNLVVEQCLGRSAFALGKVRHEREGYGTDWMWWIIEIERRQDDVSRHRQTSATIRLNEPAPGVSSMFEALWQVREWEGVGVDTFRRLGSWRPEWSDPTAKDLDDTMLNLFAAADMASPPWAAADRSHEILHQDQER